MKAPVDFNVKHAHRTDYRRHRCTFASRRLRVHSEAKRLGFHDNGKAQEECEKFYDTNFEDDRFLLRSEVC